MEPSCKDSHQRSIEPNTSDMQFLKFLLPLVTSAAFLAAQPLDERAISSSWAGVNSYFLHAYQKYEHGTPLLVSTYYEQI